VEYEQGVAVFIHKFSALFLKKCFGYRHPHLSFCKKKKDNGMWNLFERLFILKEFTICEGWDMNKAKLSSPTSFLHFFSKSASDTGIRTFLFAKERRTTGCGTFSNDCSFQKEFTICEEWNMNKA